jgi:hypothetical protein
VSEHLLIASSSFTFDLFSISTIMENNLAMIATIARASRAYSIGVRNSDLEVHRNFFAIIKGLLMLISD